jgi:hypothetical protein
LISHIQVAFISDAENSFSGGIGTEKRWLWFRFSPGKFGPLASEELARREKWKAQDLRLKKLFFNLMNKKRQVGPIERQIWRRNPMMLYIKHSRDSI